MKRTPLKRTVGLARDAAPIARTQLRRTPKPRQPRPERQAATLPVVGADAASTPQPRSKGRMGRYGHTDIPQQSRGTVAARSGGICEMAAPGPCTQTATDMHHRQRRREHHDHSPANLIHVCRRDHRLAHDRPELARAFGWIVSAWSSPAETPLMLRGDRWVLLGEGYTDTDEQP